MYLWMLTVSLKLFLLITGALQGVFSQIVNGEDQVREKAIKFLSLKLKLMGDELVNAKIEEFIVEESKKVIIFFISSFCVMLVCLV